ncbi:MAG: two-component regulator propeller domain-containing protein, partial [bacterium]
MNIRITFYLFLLAVVLWLCTILNAQERLLPVYNFKKVKGLSTDEIRAPVVRDREGYIWIGTVNGLNRCDGYGFKEYRHDPTDSNSISSNTVTSLLIDSQNRLWAGTFETGLSLYDAARDRFINFLPRSGDSTGYALKYIFDMMEDRSGNIWLGGGSAEIVKVTVPEGASLELDSIARSIHFTCYPHMAAGFLQREDSTILVASDSGLIIFDPDINTFSHPDFSDPVGCKLDSIFGICLIQDSHGNTWLGSHNNPGIFKINWHTEQVWNFESKEENNLSLSSNRVFDLAEDRQGNIWVGNKEGLHLLSPATGHYLTFLTFDTPLIQPTVYTRLSVDRTGTLWIGLAQRGLHYLTPKAQQFPHYSVPSGTERSPELFGRVDIGKGGTVWMMSLKGILYQVDLSTLNIVKTIDVFKSKTPDYGQCGSFIDEHGIYWYGTWGLGLFRVDLTSGQVKNYFPGSDVGFGRAAFNHIDQGSGDSLWIASSYGGVMKFDPVSERFIKAPVKADNPWAVMRDRQGMIWITTEVEGIVILNPVSGEKEYLRHDP